MKEKLLLIFCRYFRASLSVPDIGLPVSTARSQAVGFSLRLDSMHPTEQKDSRRKGSSFKKGETFKL
jgi:hypothetical protein